MSIRRESFSGEKYTSLGNDELSLSITSGGYIKKVESLERIIGRLNFAISGLIIIEVLRSLLEMFLSVHDMYLSTNRSVKWYVHSPR